MFFTHPHFLVQKYGVRTKFCIYTGLNGFATKACAGAYWRLDNCSCVILPSAVLGGRLPVFQTNPFVQPTFLQQPKKVGKKGRSRVKLVSLEAPLRPVEQPDKDVRFGCRSSGMCD